MPFKLGLFIDELSLVLRYLEHNPKGPSRSRRAFVAGDGHDLRRPRRWKGNRKGGPLARTAFNPDVSLVILDDAIADRKPEPGALPGRLRREEWLEDLRLDLCGDPGTRVADLDLDPVAGGQTRGDPDRAGLALHGLLRIDQEIHQDLLELIGVAENGGKIRLELLLQTNLVKSELMIREGGGVLDDPVHIRDLKLDLFLTGELEQVFHDLRAALRLLLDDLEGLEEGVGPVQFAQGELGVGQDAGQRILHLVRDAGAELAQGRQLLGLDQRGLRVLEGLFAAFQLRGHLIEGARQLPNLVA